MSQRISNFVEGECKRFSRFAVAAVLALLVGGSFTSTFAQEMANKPLRPLKKPRTLVCGYADHRMSKLALSVLGATQKSSLVRGSDAGWRWRAGFVVRYQSIASVCEPRQTGRDTGGGGGKLPFPIPLVNKQASGISTRTQARRNRVPAHRARMKLRHRCVRELLVEAGEGNFARPPAGLPSNLRRNGQREGRHDGCMARCYDEFY